MTDPVKVRAVLDDADRLVGAQILLVDRLRTLLDDEERELARRQGRRDEMRAAWAAHGIETPTGLTHCPRCSPAVAS